MRIVVTRAASTVSLVHGPLLGIILNPSVHLTYFCIVIGQHLFCQSTPRSPSFRPQRLVPLVQPLPEFYVLLLQVFREGRSDIPGFHFVSHTLQCPFNSTRFVLVLRAVELFEKLLIHAQRP